MSYFKYLCVLGLVCVMYSSACPTINKFQNFDIQRYMGKWYEIQKTPSIRQTGQKCHTVDYSFDQSGTVQFLFSSQNILLNNQVAMKVPAKVNPDNPANWILKFNRFGFLSTLVPFWVLETDYQNYALTYKCFSPGFFLSDNENVQILSRTPTLEPQVIKFLKARLSEISSSTDQLIPSDQNDCAYY